jgi:hypothetical protein
MKPFSRSDEAAVKHINASMPRDKQWGAAMWNIFNILYRKYCLARLNEMRRFELHH